MKRVFTIYLSLLITNVFGQIPTNGLVGYWPFTGNANDVSGSGNNGIVHNASLTTDRFGVQNSAYQFVGNDMNVVSYIVANHNNLPSGNSPRTISLWATNDSYGVPGGSGNDGHPLVAYGTPSTNSSNEIMFFTSPGGVDYIRYAGYNNDLDLPFSYTLSTWYHIVATYDGTTAKIYVNNTLIGSGNYSSWSTVLDSVVIGSQTSRTRFHNGKIDDVCIYNRVLNSSEITALYNASNCTNVTINMTQIYYVSDANFQSISPQTYLHNIDSLTTTIGGCDSIINHYSQFVFSANHCTDTLIVYDTISVTDTLIIDAVLTGVNPPNNTNTLKIFPNPAKTHIYINTGNFALMNGYSIRIENAVGQIVYNSLINQAQYMIDLSGWTGSGLYFVKIIDHLGATIDIKKIILQ